MANMPPEMMVICVSCGGEKVDYTTTISSDCEECSGTGTLDEVPCDICDTQGCPRCHHDGHLYDIQCPMCDGLGSLDSFPKCTQCNGTGWHPHPDFMT